MSSGKEFLGVSIVSEKSSDGSAFWSPSSSKRMVKVNSTGKSIMLMAASFERINMPQAQKKGARASK
jgi:hypothetical protein